MIVRVEELNAFHTIVFEDVKGTGYLTCLSKKEMIRLIRKVETFAEIECIKG